MKSTKLFRGLVLGAVALGLAACQGNPGPTEISSSGPRYSTTTIDGVQLLNMPPGQRLTPAGITAKVIDSSGGFIEIDGGRLDIPAGALMLPTTITMIGKEAPHYRYKFGPSGLQFATPATLSIQVDAAALGVDPSRLKVAGSDDLGLQWTVIGGSYDPAQGAVVVPIEHFSQYWICLN